MSDLVQRLRSVDVSWSETGEWCAEAADRIEALQADLAAAELERDALREGVAQAEAWFTEYAEAHAAKSNAAPVISDESRSRRDKAERNRMRAEYFTHLKDKQP